jgi:hypothetical protein
VLSRDREGLCSRAPGRAYEQHGENGHRHERDHHLEQCLHQQRCQEAAGVMATAPVIAMTCGS